MPPTAWCASQFACRPTLSAVILNRAVAEVVSTIVSPGSDAQNEADVVRLGAAEVNESVNEAGFPTIVSKKWVY
jgi:hypothetical protein